MTPEKAAAKIVRDLLSDLTPKRQKAVRKAIEEYASEWGDISGACAYESAGQAW